MDVILELFTFRGRANRSWYFWHTVFDGFVMVGLLLTIFVLAGLGGMMGVILGALPALGVLAAGGVAVVAVTIKRLHDLDRPGWHWWLLGVPLYNIYLGLILVFKRGTTGPNQFGPDPLSRSDQVQYLGP